MTITPITDAQLMQLRLDILEAVERAAKPVPHHVVADALAQTGSRDWIRYNLRVIDALVSTGELVRHINTDGGRNTYTVGVIDPRRSQKALRALFADDLAEASATPPVAASSTAQTPAIAPAIHTVPPKRSSPAQAAPPQMPNVTRISRTDKPEPYRPTDPLRARILGLVDEARQCSRAYLISRLWDVSKGNVDNHLWTLSKAGLLKRVGEGEYTRPEGATAANTGTSVAPKPTAKAKPVAAVATAEAQAEPQAGEAAIAPTETNVEAPTPALAPEAAPRPQNKGGRPRKIATPADIEAVTEHAAATGTAGLHVPEAGRPLPDYEGPIIGLDGARYYVRPRETLIDASAAAPPIIRRPLVIATLRRLSPMLAPDISAVVDEAVRYIEAAA